MSTPLNLQAQIWDIEAGAILQISVQRADPVTHVLGAPVSVPALATSSMITAWAIGKKKSSPGTLKLGVAYGNAFANAVIQGFGGPTYTGPIKKYRVELSRNGFATPPCTWCWLESCSLHLGGADRGILIDSEDGFSGFSRTAIDHMTFDGAPLYSVLSGDPTQPGFQIPVTTDPTNPSGGTTIKGKYYPAAFSGLRGLDKSISLAPSDRNPANLLRFGWSFNAANNPTTPAGFQNTAINADIWDDLVANALLAVLRAAAGKYDPTDRAPIGARAAYHVDIANLAAYCGYVGGAPVMSLVDTLAAGTYELTSSQALFDPSKLVITPGTESMRAQAQFEGGASNHGLPDGSTITGLECIFPWQPGLTGNEGYLNLMVCSCKTGNDDGGVFFNLHDGVLRPLSQAFDVQCLAYDGTARALVAGTEHGAFTWTQDPRGLTKLPTWAKLGKLSATILQLCIPRANTIWALADEGNGKVSIFEYPAIGGEDNTSLGFGGWSRIKQGGTIIAMAGGYGNLYYVESTDPTTLLLQQPDEPAQSVPIPQGAGVIGIDYLPTLVGVVARTTAGSAGLYAFNLGSLSPINLNPGGSNPKAGGLADAFGYLIVNRVQQSGAPSLNGSLCVLLAATDKGVYFASQKPGTTGFRWRPATAQSGVGDRNVTLVSASPTQTVCGHTFERGYAASGTQLWVSNSGFLWLFDLLQAGLDKGAFWTALAGLCGQPIPGNDVGAIVSVGVDPDLASQNGAVGRTMLTLPANSPFNLKKNFVRARRLTARNDFTYRTVQVDSAAPYNAIEIQALAEITADDSRGAITAAEQLDLAEWRFLSGASRNPLTVPLEGMTYRTQEALLPALTTGDMVDVSANQYQIGPDGTYTQIVDWQQQAFYVLTYDEVKDGSVMKVSLQVGTIMALLDDAINLLKEIVSGTSYGLSRDKRYRKIR